MKHHKTSTYIGHLRNDLTIIDDGAMKGRRIIIPENNSNKLWSNNIASIWELRIGNSIYWLNMNVYIENNVNIIQGVYGCFSFCLLVCSLSISLKQNWIFKSQDKLLPVSNMASSGLKKMLFFIISNTEGVRGLVCHAIFWTLDGF